MKITSKGQVTIPQSIRSAFGLRPGTDVEFVVEEGNLVLRSKRKGHDPVDAWLEEATGVARDKKTARIMTLTRGQRQAR
jgi:AbrB family looped-hinge helix DNA binding protein